MTQGPDGSLWRARFLSLGWMHVIRSVGWVCFNVLPPDCCYCGISLRVPQLEYSHPPVSIAGGFFTTE